jgi:hypothetical protein
LTKTKETKTMKRIQKVLFALAAVAALGLWSANPAFAHLQLTTTGGLKNVRAESHNDVVSAVDLLNQGADVAGACPAPPAVSLECVQAGTVITVNFAGDVTNAFNGFVPGDLVLCTGNTVADTAAVACADGVEIDVSVDGSDFIIAFLVDVLFDPGEGLSLSGVRVDIAAAGSGDIRATISSSGDPAGSRVTYTDPQPLVARSRPSLDIEIEGSEIDLLLCDPPEFPGVIEFTATVAELWAAVFGTDAQEAAAGNAAELPGAIDGPEIIFTITGVNAELTVNAAITDFDTPGIPAINDISQMSDGDDLEFRVSFPTSDIGAIEEFTITFTVFLAAGDDLDLDLSTVNLAAAIGPLGDFDEDDPEILLFADNGINADVFSINDCLSILLYNWLAYTGDGTYDSGLTISNTGDAPAQLKTPASQTGTCQVSFYKTDGSAPVVRPVGPLEPGQTGTLVVSSALGAPFTGYAIAVCNFQWGHGFSFISNPGGVGGNFAQGADAQVLVDRTGIAVESAGE